jgi:pimeloyl-ACP methyl ester carboxylesterase
VVLLVLPMLARARLVEEKQELPVQVQDAYGKTIEHSIKLTVFYDNALPGPHPVLVLNHGRAPDSERRQALGRARYSEASRYFTRWGFLVVVPTRIGYGITGGEDVENSGSCQRKNYPPGYAAAADETLAVLRAMRQRPDAAKDHSVIVGQSYGGATAIAVAARAEEGVVAAVNFAGGGGGNPKTRPGDPCMPQAMQSLFAGYGRTTRIPTLWIYTENDLYMGPKHPREWFDAFRAAGGQGEFVQFPPHGEDGHSLFTRFADTWQPVVADFLRRVGFTLP